MPPAHYSGVQRGIVAGAHVPLGRHASHCSAARHSPSRPGFLGVRARWTSRLRSASRRGSLRVRVLSAHPERRSSPIRCTHGYDDSLSCVLFASYMKTSRQTATLNLCCPAGMPSPTTAPQLLQQRDGWNTVTAASAIFIRHHMLTKPITRYSVHTN